MSLLTQRLLLLTVLVLLPGCGAGLTAFTSEVENTYDLVPADLERIQFYVGVMEGPSHAHHSRELVIRYRSSAMEREADIALTSETRVTEKDFVIKNRLPGVFSADLPHGQRQLSIDIGSGVVLGFRATGSADSPYTLASINGSPFVEGSRVRIDDLQFVVERTPEVQLLFNKDDAIEVFRERISAEGRRVR